MASQTRPPAAGGSALLIQLSGVLLLGAIIFTAGLIAGLPLGHARAPVVTEASKAAAYDRVRAANITGLEQALTHIRADCGVDADRCSLSLAYALALDQKFQDELAPIAVPKCAAGYDQSLRQALRQIEANLKQALADLASIDSAVAGLSDLQALDQVYAQAGCATTS